MRIILHVVVRLIPKLSVTSNDLAGQWQGLPALFFSLLTLAVWSLQVTPIGSKIFQLSTGLIRRHTQRACRTILHTFPPNLLQPFLDAPVERRRHSHIKASPDEGQAEGFTSQLSQLDADTA